MCFFLAPAAAGSAAAAGTAAAGTAAAGTAAAGTAAAATTAAATTSALSTAASVASLVGAGVSVYGMYQQGQQSKKLGEYNAQVAERDAQQKESLAIDASRRGQIAEDLQRDKTRQALASQRAAFAANGDSLIDQSTLSIFGDTASAGELDALTIRSNAAREAWGIRNSAANSLTQATSSRMQGNAAATAGTLSAAGTLISGGAKAYRYSQYKDLKVD